MELHLLQAVNWKELLMGSEEWNFLSETTFRTVIMFIVILIGLRVLGKRGIKQLSVFELVVIIGLGSAAGDPMFYKDVGILPAILVFLIVISLYKLITYLIGKNKKFEELIEGKPICLIKDGEFSVENFKKEDLGEDEFFAELRMQGVSQLGQVEEAIVESSGNVSVFFYEEKDVKYGLSVMPGTLDGGIKVITVPGYYSCTFCGHTEKQKPATVVVCSNCRKTEWVEASNRKRVS